MSDGMIHDLLDEIATDIVMADLDDPSSFSKILNELETLQDHLQVDCPNGVKIAEACFELLSDIITEKTSDDKAAFEQACGLVADLQHMISDPDGCQADKSEDPSEPDPETRLEAKEEIQQQGDSENTAPVESKDQHSFVLPEHIDEKIFNDFLSSTESSLQEIEADILAFESGDTAQIKDLRGRLHTLKGETGVIGLSEVEKVCHALEDFLEIEPRRSDWVDVLLSTKDWIAKAFEFYAAFQMPTPGADEIVTSLFKKPEIEKVETEVTSPFKEALTSLTNKTVELSEDSDTMEMLSDFLSETADELVETDNVLLEVETEGQDEEKINKLFRIFHSAKGVAGFLGLPDIVSLAHATETMLSKVRDGELALQKEVLDLCFDATAMLRELMTRVDNAMSSDMMLASHEDLPSLILKIKAATEGFSPPAAELPLAQPDDKLGEILLRPPPSIPLEVVEAALAAQQTSGRKLGEELIAGGKVEPKKVSQSLRAQQSSQQGTVQQGETSAKTNEMIKVDLGRVDSLVALVGELAVVESMVVHNFESMSRDLKSDSSVNRVKSKGALRQFQKISKDLQNIGLQMRMVPVRGVFQKMSRLVRDLAKKQDKKIRLVLTGETTEMDRSMVEHIGDPLVHLIRNSVDHGIESPQGRKDQGKSTEGTIELSAYHEGGIVIIEIQDDGRGIDKEAVLKKAIANGLISENHSLTDKEIWNLIFEPGFSTAKQVSEVSGRGVGMDVVKRSIESMHGRISIHSESGKGSSIRLMLPLTLAIIDGMIIRCGEERHIIPTLSIIESLKPTPGMFFNCGGKDELIRLRDELIPLVHLNNLLQVKEIEVTKGEAMVVVVESTGGKIGLVVDEVKFRQQVVIKTLATDGGENPIFSGAAILSDGRVGLIINVEQIRNLMDLGHHREEIFTQPQLRQDGHIEMEPATGTI